MNPISRRGLLQTGAALGTVAGLPLAAASEESDGDHHASWDGSPDLEKFAQPLPIPETREPDGRDRGAPYHEVSVEAGTHSFHPDIPDSKILGFDGQFPGPIIESWQYRRLRVHFDTSDLPTEHVFEVDEEIRGTTTENYHDYDGPVPEVRQVTHFHGLNTPTASDGQADMWTSPEGVTGPRFSEPVQEIPNRNARMSTVYHDHARGISRLNNYAGLVGPYIVKGWRERHMGLPEDEHDVPLVLADRAFHEDGLLYYPDEFVANFAGDVATVNGAAWPTFEVEPRRYRFRILNPSNGRTYGLNLASEGDGHDGDSGDHDDGGEGLSMYQIATGHGFLEEVVEIGHGGDMETLVIAPFERAEVVVDFSDHAGETITMTNDAQFPYSGGSHGDGHDGGMGNMDSDGEMGGDDGHGGGDHPQIHEIMQFEVAEESDGWDRTRHPTDLRMPYRHTPTERAAQETRQISMEMQMGSDPGLHTLNDKRWGDPIEIEPQLGTTEVWEISNTSMHTHPLHLHLVEFTVIGRGQDGTEPPHPNERGGKDVVRVNPDETVRIAVKFGDFAGKYPFHCHVLEHEEHEMMRMFEVVNGHDRGNGRGRGHDREDDDDDDREWGDDDDDDGRGWG
ncbi:putative multicopper oxidase [Salinarchaeum sp. Harcht-Bsk1]|uniref:multicopper oxidase family protein n=1 Tax=Salinarchaeum sp. Harcht-Bsk1 TaxID=1333523 RepID=UPI0003423A4E|nr:multicopper oxidase domain-containing protein [Salinarchaeum sp. Harcht-Bsk1]AGN01022.1 putative multicopper oxidase [Salinarchaeum sp. Harcht-Bsk1]